MRCKALLLFAPRPPGASTDEGPVFSWTGLPLGYRGKAFSAGGLLFSFNRLQQIFCATAPCRGCSLDGQTQSFLPCFESQAMARSAFNRR